MKKISIEMKYFFSQRRKIYQFSLDAFKIGCVTYTTNEIRKAKVKGTRIPTNIIRKNRFDIILVA